MSQRFSDSREGARGKIDRKIARLRDGNADAGLNRPDGQVGPARDGEMGRGQGDRYRWQIKDNLPDW